MTGSLGVKFSPLTIFLAQGRVGLSCVLRGLFSQSLRLRRGSSGSRQQAEAGQVGGGGAGAVLTRRAETVLRTLHHRGTCGRAGAQEPVGVLVRKPGGLAAWVQS